VRAGARRARPSAGRPVRLAGSAPGFRTAARTVGASARAPPCASWRRAAGGGYAGGGTGQRQGRGSALKGGASSGIIAALPARGRSEADLLEILSILAPVLLVIGLGWALSRLGFLSRQALFDLNRLSYWIGLPCLLVVRIGAARPALADVAGLLVVAAGGTALAMLLAAALAWLLRMPARSLVTFVQGAYRGNLTFIGLPVVLYAFAGTGAAASAEAAALIAFAPMVVLYNVAAVALLLAPRSAGVAGTLRAVGHGLVTNPILISALIGLAISLGAWGLPQVLERGLSAVGQMALPLALLCIGGSLHTARIEGRVLWGALAAAFKVAVVPLVGLGLGLWIGLSAEHLRIALILLACPTASASYVLVLQLRGDAALASTTIVMSYLFALPAMFAVLALTG